MFTERELSRAVLAQVNPMYDIVHHSTTVRPLDGETVVEYTVGTDAIDSIEVVEEHTTARVTVRTLANGSIENSVTFRPTEYVFSGLATDGSRRAVSDTIQDVLLEHGYAVVSQPVEPPSTLTDERGEISS